MCIGHLFFQARSLCCEGAKWGEKQPTESVYAGMCMPVCMRADLINALDHQNTVL